METTTLKVEGMTCGHCKQAVEKALTDLEGVQSASVVVDKGIADVSYDTSMVSLQEMKAAVEEQGYDVR